MAKARAECVCRVCEKKFYKESTLSNRTAANDWEHWATDYFDLCPSCYGKQQWEKEKAKGLYVDIRLDGQGAYHEDTLPIAIIFGGDTMPYKDTIKSLGAHYTTEYPSDGILGDILMMRTPKLRWVLYCRVDEIQSKIEQVKNIGAKINSTPSDTDLALYQQILYNTQKKKTEKEQAIRKEMEEIGEIPSWPAEIVKNWPDGTKWNGKFYGKPGRWCVYFSGEKVALTNEQKIAMEKIQEERRLWREKKQCIENKYK